VVDEEEDGMTNAPFSALSTIDDAEGWKHPLWVNESIKDTLSSLDK
jgi:hypothetical protein